MSIDQPASAMDRRFYRRQNRIVLGLAVVAVIASISGSLIVEKRGAARDSTRDEAQKYQRCVQTATTAVQANASRRDNLELSRLSVEFNDALGALAGVSATGTPAQRTRLVNAAGALERKSREVRDNAAEQDPSPVPDCPALYPSGFDASIELGPIIPTTSSP